jgi:hypothetical protein
MIFIDKLIMNSHSPFFEILWLMNVHQSDSKIIFISPLNFLLFGFKTSFVLTSTHQHLNTLTHQY